MATITRRPIDFVLNETGDQLVTSRIVLDEGQPPVSIAVRYQSVMEGWTCTVTQSDGTVLISDALLNHLEGVFSNVVAPMRPAGDIVPITRDGSDPGRDAWTRGGRLYYVTAGLDDLWREKVELIA